MCAGIRFFSHSAGKSFFFFCSPCNVLFGIRGKHWAWDQTSRAYKTWLSILIYQSDSWNLFLLLPYRGFHLTFPNVLNRSGWRLAIQPHMFFFFVGEHNSIRFHILFPRNAIMSFAGTKYTNISLCAVTTYVSCLLCKQFLFKWNSKCEKWKKISIFPKSVL